MNLSPLNQLISKAKVVGFKPVSEKGKLVLVDCPKCFHSMAQFTHPGQKAVYACPNCNSRYSATQYKAYLAALIDKHSVVEDVCLCHGCPGNNTPVPCTSCPR